MKKYIFFFLLFFLPTSISLSNKLKDNSINIKEHLLINYLVLQNDTSINEYRRGKNGLIVLPDSAPNPFSDNITFRDTVIYNPAYLPVVFDGKILPEHLNFLSLDSISEGYKLELIPREKTFAPLIDRLEAIHAQRRNFYMNMNNVQNVRYSLTQLKEIPKIDEYRAVKRNILEELIATEEPLKISPIEIEQIQPIFKYWSKSGDHSLQIAQNYISDNWYNGGNSSFFIRNYHKVQINYKKDKVTFNSVFEWKLSLQQTPADTVHNINFSEDQLRIENTLGYQAFKHWSYSAKLETKSPLFNSYPINSNAKNTGFLSPLIVNLGLGMSYLLDKSFENNITKKFKLVQNVAPFSVNFTYVADNNIDETRFGLASNDRYKIEIGSLINTDLTYTFNKFTSWTSRFKYFTNYHRVEVEFENKFNMSLNRYLSTNINFYLRYDDNANRYADLGYFQINELVSFGLSYKW